LSAFGKGVLPLLDDMKAVQPEVRDRLAAIRASFELKPSLDRIAWHSGNSGNGPHPVGGKEPNEFGLHDFGLYDMYGNVWEWVQDTWHDSYEGAPADGRARIDHVLGASRVTRGGGWSTLPKQCRSASRYGEYDGSQMETRGFRVAVEVQP
jgi:formylglycine-generating enzyme required for sulfatase activity